jgi:hypothetical protein
VARRRETARRLRILERLPGLAVENLAREGDHGATHTTLGRLLKLDRYDGFATPLLSLSAEASSPRRTIGPRRELPAPNSAPPEAGGENFSWLQSLAITLN